MGSQLSPLTLSIEEGAPLERQQRSASTASSPHQSRCHRRAGSPRAAGKEFLGLSTGRKHRGAIILCRGGATFPTGLGGRETGRGAVPTESAFPRGGQTTNGAREGHRAAASRTRKN